MSERREVPASLMMKLDFAPVRPLPRAEVRFGVVAVLALAAGAAMLLSLGARTDTPLTSPLFLAMLLARVAAGVLLALLALRDAIPGSRPLGGAMAATVAFGAFVLFVLPIVFTPGPAPFGPGFCFPLIVAVALPSFVALLWLLRRAYPLHPVRAAALAGLGSGLLSEAAQFVACSNAGAVHGSVVHGGAAVSVALAGAVVGWLLARGER
ncbi:MAG TPA: NrsF family protein [Thermoanaerobaculia bacterium]